MTNQNLNNLPFEIAKDIESLKSDQQQIFFENYNKLKKKKPFLYFCLFFGYNHYFQLGRPALTFLGLITGILIPYSLTLLVLVEMFRLPKVIRNYNSKLASALINNLKKNKDEFDLKELSTASYSNKEVITHVFFDFPKKITPVILSLKEKIIFAVVWFALIGILFNTAVNNASKFTSNKGNTTASNSNKKLFSNKTPSCKDQEVLDTFEDLASKLLVKEAGHGAYINKVHSVEELGYNPKSKVRLCRARVMVLSASDNNTYVTFLVDYTTTKSRVEISDRWLPI